MSTILLLLLNSDLILKVKLLAKRQIRIMSLQLEKTIHYIFLLIHMNVGYG